MRPVTDLGPEQVEVLTPEHDLTGELRSLPGGGIEQQPRP